MYEKSMNQHTNHLEKKTISHGKEKKLVEQRNRIAGSTLWEMPTEVIKYGPEKLFNHFLCGKCHQLYPLKEFMVEY